MSATLIAVMDSATKKKRPLGPQQQRVLAMTRGGMKPREIAGALGITTQAVYLLLGKLRAKGIDLSPEEVAS